MFSLPGAFSPSPFLVLPDLGMAAPHCVSSAAASSERHSLTVLCKAPLSLSPTCSFSSLSLLRFLFYTTEPRR